MINTAVVKMLAEFKDYYSINEDDINHAFKIYILLIFLLNFLNKYDLQNE